MRPCAAAARAAAGMCASRVRGSQGCCGLQFFLCGLTGQRSACPAGCAAEQFSVLPSAPRWSPTSSCPTAGSLRKSIMCMLAGPRKMSSPLLAWCRLVHDAGKGRPSCARAEHVQQRGKANLTGRASCVLKQTESLVDAPCGEAGNRCNTHTQTHRRRTAAGHDRWATRQRAHGVTVSERPDELAGRARRATRAARSRACRVQRQGVIGPCHRHAQGLTLAQSGASPATANVGRSACPAPLPSA